MTKYQIIEELASLIYEKTNIFFKSYDIAEEIYNRGYRKTTLPYIKLKTCRCGSNRREFWHTSNGSYYVCYRCGLQSAIGKTARQARKNWNIMIDNLEKEYDKHN